MIYNVLFFGFICVGPFILIAFVAAALCQRWQRKSSLQDFPQEDVCVDNLVENNEQQINTDCQ
jgi:hypothetical protein